VRNHLPLQKEKRVRKGSSPFLFSNPLEKGGVLSFLIWGVGTIGEEKGDRPTPYLFILKEEKKDLFTI